MIVASRKLPKAFSGSAKTKAYWYPLSIRYFATFLMLKGGSGRLQVCPFKA